MLPGQLNVWTVKSSFIIEQRIALLSTFSIAWMGPHRSQNLCQCISQAFLHAWFKAEASLSISRQALAFADQPLHFFCGLLRQRIASLAIHRSEQTPRFTQVRLDFCLGHSFNECIDVAPEI